MEITEKLLESGLTRNEAKVYLELSKKGESSANQIAKELGIDRTLTYTILNHLIEKGQVTYIKKENKKIFSCANPENLLNSIKSKEFLIIQLIEDLKKVSKQKQEEVNINVYEGKNGLRNFINLALKEKEILSFGFTGKVFTQLYEIPGIIKQIENKEIKIKIIASKEYEQNFKNKIKKFQFKFLKVHSESTTTIFGDYISIHLIKDKPIIIIIKNKDIAFSYKNYFNYLWKA